MPPAPVPEPAATQSPEPAPPTPDPDPVVSTRLEPPQVWNQRSRRTDGTEFDMGTVLWEGGDRFTVAMFGTMKYVLMQGIGQAIKDNPDDPAAAIQGVLDGINKDYGEDSTLRWVRKE